MKERLKKAAEEGLLLGIKFGLATAIYVFSSFYMYQWIQEVTVGARQGSASFAYINGEIKAGRLNDPAKAAVPQLPAPSPSPEIKKN